MEMTPERAKVIREVWADCQDDYGQRTFVRKELRERGRVILPGPLPKIDISYFDHADPIPAAPLLDRFVFSIEKGYIGGVLMARLVCDGIEVEEPWPITGPR